MKEILDFISRYSDFSIVSHRDPDGDCIGSSIALGRFLLGLGKTLRLYSPGPFNRFGIEDYEVFFDGRPFVCGPETGIIVLDCSTLDRIGHFARNLTGETAVIDHHSSGTPFGSARYIDASAPSTTYLVYRLMKEAGAHMDEETAQWLLFGLCTDTGFFRHLDAGSAGVFEAAAELAAAGANPNKAYGTMFGGRTLSSRRLLGRLLDRTESCRDGRLLLTYETLDDLRETLPGASGIRKAAAADRDSDTLYSLLQGVRHAEVVIFVREEGPGLLSAGLRSNNHLDVGAIAKSFGGGGHKKAAGLEYRGSLDELKGLLKEAVLKLMED
ncbi:MAG: bifunctional oligoribonuclease/PAP phosphatase NrnA [Spirochaetales bacterium]|nr:MAG: bifunctional oligoribonuclease/PAP phosphatase NrnA [Spirochaetales bacterium]